MKCKAFDNILKEIHYNPEKVYRWLNDKRLTLLEKKIIEGHMLIRSNKNNEVANTFLKLPESDIDFVNAHKYLILGISYNNLSQFQEAQHYLKRAEKILSQLELNFYLFNTRFNLFIVATNLNLLDEMRSSLLLLEQTPREVGWQEIRLHRCQFMYADKSDDLTGATKLLHKLSIFKKEMTENDLIAQLVSEFSFYIKIENFELARETLVQMKNYRKFNLSENFNFMKTLLDHLTKNTPVYAYDLDYKMTPMLLHQLKVIQALESHELDTAEINWKLLQETFPHTYLDSFQYKGQKCLFSLCLDKHLAIETSQVISILKINEDGSTKENKLLELIQTTKTPLSKNFLYQALWGEEAASKEELHRLSKMISKLRNKHGINIQSRKGTYFIESDTLPIKKAS